jgi:hypothetical protein
MNVLQVVFFYNRNVCVSTYILGFHIYRWYINLVVLEELG